jgi:hypothetical protein
LMLRRRSSARAVPLCFGSPSPPSRHSTNSAPTPSVPDTRLLRRAARTFCVDKLHMSEQWSNLLSGGFASTVGKTAVFPFDLVRKRLQVQGPTRQKYVYRNIPVYSGVLGAMQDRISSSTKDSVDTRVPAIGVGGTGAGGNLFILDTSSIGFRRGKRTCATSESSGGVATSTAILALRAAVKSTRATHGLCVPRRRISLRLQRPRHPPQPRVRAPNGYEDKIED